MYIACWHSALSISNQPAVCTLQADTVHCQSAISLQCTYCRMTQCTASQQSACSMYIAGWHSALSISNQPAVCTDTHADVTEQNVSCSVQGTNRWVSSCRWIRHGAAAILCRSVLGACWQRSEPADGLLYTKLSYAVSIHTVRYVQWLLCCVWRSVMGTIITAVTVRIIRAYSDLFVCWKLNINWWCSEIVWNCAFVFECVPFTYLLKLFWNVV